MSTEELNTVMADLLRDLVLRSLQNREALIENIVIPNTPLKYKVRVENVERDADTDVILKANIYVVFKGFV